MTKSINTDEMITLKLSLHDVIIGYLLGFKSGKNILIFTEDFKNNASRPTFSLITHPNFPNVKKILSASWIRQQRLHPILSNLLPEGALREFVASYLKIHIDEEFKLFSYLGNDLPGALIATLCKYEDIPSFILKNYQQTKIITPDYPHNINKFSLTGIQMKFSVKEKDGRYNLSVGDTLGDWIIKTPSTKHKEVPFNEYTAMSLAALAGVKIPEIKLIKTDKIDNLPPINLPNEQFAFAIKRFDRNNRSRIHIEDFAQVLVKYPHEKYNSANYEQLARILYTFSGEPNEDIKQFTKRLLTNILLANGDAHLKNWSLIYKDKITPTLSPAYDIVTTCVYIENETQYALNLGKTKQWYNVNYSNFEVWSRKSDIPWHIVKTQLDETMKMARSLWPKALKDLPMNNFHKKQLIDHWHNLHTDFQIKK